MNNTLKSDERLDDLELDGLAVIQSKSGYAFTSDSVMLANFVSAGHKDRVVELCAGCGVISLIMGYKKNPKSLTLVELQEAQADRARRSFEMNNMQAEVICSKLQGVHKKIGEYAFDVCLANPPYRKLTQDMSEVREVSLSTHEVEVNLKDLVIEAEKLLKFGGRFFVVYPASRLAELMHELMQVKIEPKRLTLVQPKANKPAELVLMEAVKGGKHGLLISENIIQNDENGKPTPIMRAIYNSR